MNAFTFDPKKLVTKPRSVDGRHELQATYTLPDGRVLSDSITWRTGTLFLEQNSELVLRMRIEREFKRIVASLTGHGHMAWKRAAQ